MEHLDINPNLVAAVVYRPEDDIDSLLADFALEALGRGERIGGVVQRNIKDDRGRKLGMNAIDLTDGREIPLSQNLGPGSMACMLDAASLAEVSCAVLRAIERRVDLVVVNKFAKQEAAGRGLRDEIAAAIVAGAPVLTATPQKCFDAWIDFTGDRGTTLLCDPAVVRGWWRSVRDLRRRAFVTGRASISQSSRPTI